ncbi:hypothetical protein AURDEDRAFT_160831 [Auricularia subglabra TFB-10046 SS5]|nr:hypothetical protein AURDEDRAFT_160831 [Auricularia subglabra TFB-10046 SS5]
MVLAFEFSILALLAAIVCDCAAGAQVKLEDYTPIRQEDIHTLSEAAGPQNPPGNGYMCPSGDAGARALVSSAMGDDAFSCTFASGSCTYQTTSGALTDDANDGDCFSEAVAGPTRNSANEAGKPRNARRKRDVVISSRQLQEVVIRNIL